MARVERTSAIAARKMLFIGISVGVVAGELNALAVAIWART